MSKIFFISGPSGVGKGSLIHGLKSRHPEYIFPPSCTTRNPRPNEKQGDPYFFISKESFLEKIKNDEFLEWAKVHEGYLYGTLKKTLLDPIKENKTVIKEFDVQGFLQIRNKLSKKNYTSIFLYPAEPVENLVERIRTRAPISNDDLKKRIHSMKKEMELASLYDHKIISVEKNIDKLIRDAEKIIEK